MVNASLNWASIVGIVLAVCGAGLYFMRSFKPALARDYDVFFAAIGLLCGGILFFQGWRLDPILQFGQFLLAGTTVFFAYESVRLRGITADQARRSSYFDDEPAAPRMPTGRQGGGWDESYGNYDRFEEAPPLRRRFSSQDRNQEQGAEEDFYQPNRSSRAAIPEQAASRRRRARNDENRSWDQSPDRARRMARFSRQDEESNSGGSFGERRNRRQEQRRGSRPSINEQNRSRTSSENKSQPSRRSQYSNSPNPGIPKGSPIRTEAEDAAFSSKMPKRTGSTRPNRSRSSSPRSNEEAPNQRSTNTPLDRQSSREYKPRDNSSRFDD